MLEALRLLFARLICFNIKLSIVKSKFCRPSASYCGIEISRDGYTISPKRKKILEQYPDFDVRTRKKNNDLRHLGFYNWHTGSFFLVRQMFSKSPRPLMFPPWRKLQKWTNQTSTICLPY